MFREATFLAVHSLCGANLHDHSVVFVFAVWFDLRNVVNDISFVPYAHDSHLLENILYLP